MKSARYMEEPKLNPGGTAAFASTHWSRVMQACNSQAPDCESALEKLCVAYWYPLYVYVRSRGHGPEEARDLTQEFFARLLEKKWLREADPGRGRFRTFLLTAMMHFLANDWRRGQTAKRGGGMTALALDGLEAEERFALEPRDNMSPDALYDRRWALTLINRAQDRLQKEQAAAGESARFAAIEPALAGDRFEVGYRELAEQFAVTESTVKSWVLRLRRRFRELLLDEIAETVGPDDNPECELKALLATLGG